MTELAHLTPLERAIAAAGNASALARKLSITPQAVIQWKEIPHDRLADVADATGIPAHELRPDLAALFAKPTRKPKPSREGVGA